MRACPSCSESWERRRTSERTEKWSCRILRNAAVAGRDPKGSSQKNYTWMILESTWFKFNSTLFAMFFLFFSATATHRGFVQLCVAAVRSSFSPSDLCLVNFGCQAEVRDGKAEQSRSSFNHLDQYFLCAGRLPDRVHGELSPDCRVLEKVRPLLGQTLRVFLVSEKTLGRLNCSSQSYRRPGA